MPWQCAQECALINNIETRQTDCFAEKIRFLDQITQATEQLPGVHHGGGRKINRAYIPMMRSKKAYLMCRATTRDENFLWRRILRDIIAQRFGYAALIPRCKGGVKPCIPERRCRGIVLREYRRGRWRE